MVMNIKVTDYCTASNSSMGVNEAIKNMQSGDTLLFPTGEYHFYKDFSIHKVCYMTNTDSFQFIGIRVIFITLIIYQSHFMMRLQLILKIKTTSLLMAVVQHL